MRVAEKKTRRKQKRERDGDSGEMHIYISPVMFIMAVCFTAMGLAYEFFCSLAAVLMHECAHARVAKKLGYELNTVKLMPYGAALCGDCDMKPWHEIRIALAGPILNLIVATLFAALWWLVPQSYMFTQAFCANNLYIGLFNLLPVYPLDGGRVLLAVMSSRMKRDKAYKITRIISAVMGLVAIALFAVSAIFSLNVCFLCVGIFMLVSAFIPDDRARYRALFAVGSRAARISEPLEVRKYVLSEDTLLSAVCGTLDADKYTQFDVFDRRMNKVGSFDETELIERVRTLGYEVKAGDIVKKSGKI